MASRGFKARKLGSAAKLLVGSRASPVCTTPIHCSVQQLLGSADAHDRMHSSHGTAAHPTIPQVVLRKRDNFQSLYHTCTFQHASMRAACHFGYCSWLGFGEMTLERYTDML